MSRRAVLTGILAIAAACSGCAAAKSGAPPASEPGAAQGYGQAASPSGGAQVSQAPPYSQPPQPPPPPPPPPPSSEAAPTTPSTSSTPKPAQPGGGATGTGTSRSVAIQSAAREVESSQRELDVAGSDCRNACRALGSMDRAAGRLCELSQGDGEPQRCEDAKRRVYSARDRVKTTCGSCADGTTVERAAPIPSR